MRQFSMRQFSMRQFSMRQFSMRQFSMRGPRGVQWMPKGRFSRPEPL
jgi:hypothetical protein